MAGYYYSSRSRSLVFDIPPLELGESRQAHLVSISPGTGVHSAPEVRERSSNSDNFHCGQ
jgi:hypothetical protein